jgi:hypothetical protein
MARVIVSSMLATLALVAGTAAAQPAVTKAPDPAPNEAVAKFLMGTRLGYITCSGKYRSYLEKRDLYDLVNAGQGNARMSLPSSEEATACVHETMFKGRSLYDAAAKQTSAPAGKTALKEYMTAWEASLAALPAKQPEKPREFDARLKKQEARLDELQQRLEATAK